MKNDSSQVPSVRLDKNIAHNAYDFKIYEKDENLLKSIVLYICYSYQNHILEYGTIDPYDFCKVMNYKSRAYLFRNHSNPAQLQGMSEEQVEQLKNSGEYIWDSELENVLYRLSTEPLKLSYSGKTFEGKIVHGIDSILILESIQVVLDAKNKKRYYKFKASNKFLNNLSRYFTNINLEAFNNLRKSGLQNLYLFLTNLKDNILYKNEDRATVNFDLLCNLAEIKNQENKQKKKYLIKALEKVNQETKINIELSWNQNGRYFYQPVFKFQMNEQKTKLQRAVEMTEAFDTALLKVLVKLYNELHPDLLQFTTFKDWFNDSKKNRYEKAWAYVKVQYEIFGRTVEADSLEVQKFLDTRQYEIPDIEK
ncbi:hypothetical protein AD998_21330 [bacterium 336/3]|nr:hypothetical protein AD998_21330 [bacterium 336/3]